MQEIAMNEVGNIVETNGEPIARVGEITKKFKF